MDRFTLPGVAYLTRMKYELGRQAQKSCDARSEIVGRFR